MIKNNNSVHVMNISEVLLRANTAYAEQLELVLNKTGYLAHSELYKRASAIARYLHEQIGLAPGERVVLIMESRTEYIEIMLAAWHAGLVVVPMHVKLGLTDLLDILQSSQAGACITSNKLYSQLLEQSAELPPSLATIINVDTDQYSDLIDETRSTLSPHEMNYFTWLNYSTHAAGQLCDTVIPQPSTILRSFLNQVSHAVYHEGFNHGTSTSNFCSYNINPYEPKSEFH